jgi:hypothetical protein
MHARPVRNFPFITRVRRTVTLPCGSGFTGGRPGGFARAGGRCWVSARVVGVDARVPGSRVSGLRQCRVAAFGLSDLLRLANLFITISHCAWQHVISWSLATKKRSKENALTALP